MANRAMEKQLSFTQLPIDILESGILETLAYSFLSAQIPILGLAWPIRPCCFRQCRHGNLVDALSRETNTLGTFGSA
jgi:hypothetical protein